MLKALRQPLRAGQWQAIEDALAYTRLSVKGVGTPVRALARLAARRRLVDVRVVVEEVLESEVTSERIACTLRVAVVGHAGGAVDGVISDVRLGVVRSGRQWFVVRIDAGCPPEPALWQNRRNPPSSVYRAFPAEGSAMPTEWSDGCPDASP